MKKKPYPNGGKRGGSQDEEGAPPGPPPKDGEDYERPDQDDDDEPDDMHKSLDRLTDTLERAIADAAPHEARKGELLRKSQGAGLTQDEEAELGGLLTAQGTLRDDATAPFAGDSLAKSINGTPFLEALSDGIAESIGVMSDRLEKSEERGTRFQVAIAESQIELAEMIGKQAEVIDQLQKSIDAMRGAPVRQPRSVPGVGATPRRSAADIARGGGEDNRLTKSMAKTAVTNALTKGIRKLAGYETGKLTALFDGNPHAPVPDLPESLERELRAHLPKESAA